MFSADDGTNGQELWITDGSSAGTTLIADLNSGPAHSSLSLFEGAVVGNEVLFYANVAPEGYELWKSDGTTLGTILVKDVFPGSRGSSGRNLTRVSGGAYFSASGASNDRELWFTDGTTAGTNQVADINPSGSSDPEPGIELGGHYYFQANGELYRTDGTSLGTTLAVDLDPGSVSDPSSLTPVSSTHFLASMYTTATGYELFLSDGTTAGTQLVVDLGVDAGSSAPTELHVAFGERLYFSAGDDVHGREPWVSDSSGTSLLLDIQPGAEGSSPRDFATLWVNGRVLTFFSADDGTTGREPWISDGTALDTMPLGDLNPGSEGSFAAEFVPCGSSQVMFHAFDGTDGFLYVSDGTPQGTQRLPTGCVGPEYLFPHEGRVYFRALGANGWELWVSDGTEAGTFELRDINPGPGNDSIPYRFTAFDGEVYFNALGPEGRELWKTDGTSAGTVLVADINPSGSSNPYFFAVCGDKLYFDADDGVTGDELWMTDGTAAGTTQVVDVLTGPESSRPRELICSGDGRLFFVTEDEEAETRYLHVTDGTSTTSLGNLFPGVRYVEPRRLTAASNGVYFTSFSSVGDELGYSDGTVAGTQIVCDIETGERSSFPDELVVFGGSLYFSAQTLATGRELFALRGVATVETLGAQPMLGSSRVFAASDPLLGAVLEFRWKGSGVNERGLCFLDTPQPLYANAFLGNASYFAVRPTSLLLSVVASAEGTLNLPIPNDPQLRRLRMRSQMLWIDLQTLFPLTPSRGLQLTLGD